jgi:hypothetical protein
MFDEYQRGKQPCGKFTPNEREEWFGTPHGCPTCGREGCRRFCLNCNRDHHENGWDTCTPNKELSPSSTVSPKDTDALLATIRKHVEKIPCHDCRSVPCWYCELKRLVIDEKVEAPK